MAAYANCLILIIHFVPSVALLQAGLLLINCLYTLWLLAFGYISSDVLLYLIFANFDTLRFFNIRFSRYKLGRFLNLRNLLGFHSKHLIEIGHLEWA